MATVVELRDDELVKLYIGLRDRRAKRKAAYETEDAPDAKKMDKIEGILLKRMQDSGQESVRTSNGTAYKSIKRFTSVGDWESLLTYVRNNDAWELLTRGVSKSAVEQYRAVNEDVPPGVNMRTEVTVNFLRS
jgi:hypothetical protein